MADQFAESLPQHRAAEELEQALGDPFDPRTPFSLANAVELDEREEFPEAAVAALVAWGYLDRMVPADQGGRLVSFEEAVALQRCVSRRDLTAAIALGQTFLGSVAVWLAGTSEQRQWQAALLRSGGLAALALTEQAHGTDILASDVRAAPAGPNRVRLDGSKWLINNGTRARALTVFAREGDGEGLAGFSLFLVDKEALAPDAFNALPKKRTLGIRGADISGIELRAAELPDGARIGRVGSGAELLLQSLQITRIGCCGFSLGAADTGLRIAAEFARARKLYGGRVWDIPHAQASLGGAFVDLLVSDAVATAAARAVQSAPEQLSFISAIAKAFVPSQVEAVLREAAVVLGARHYLREGLHGGAFQKVLRDAAVVSLFDGSLPVNLDAIGTQLLRLSPRAAAPPDQREEVLAATFDLLAPLAPIDPSRLALLNGGRDDVTQGLEEVLEHREAWPSSPWTDEIEAHARTAVAELGRAARELDQLASQDRAALKRSPELFDLAMRHCRLWAAAASVQLWVRSGSLLGPYIAEGSWLALGLDRLLGVFDAPRPPRRHPALALAAEELSFRLDADLALSIAPMRLASRKG